MRTPDPLLLRVSSVRRATATTRIVRLDLGGAAFAYESGQTATLSLGGNAEGVPYSIASAPEESKRFGWLEFLIKVEASGRWGQRFERIARGMSLEVRGPYGAFTIPPHHPERRFLFIAGGTGIAPIRSMLRHLELSREASRARLLYSARTPEEFPYLQELRRMVKHGSLEVTLTATREFGGRQWRGERGRIGAALLTALVDDPRTLCFVCGPAAMVTDVPLMLMGLGVAKSRIRVEQW
jgi:ferredoxin-NADP reductase